MARRLVLSFLSVLWLHLLQRDWECAERTTRSAAGIDGVSKPVVLLPLTPLQPSPFLPSFVPPRMPSRHPPLSSSSIDHP